MIVAGGINGGSETCPCRMVTSTYRALNGINPVPRHPAAILSPVYIAPRASTNSGRNPPSK